MRKSLQVLGLRVRWDEVKQKIVTEEVDRRDVYMANIVIPAEYVILLHPAGEISFVAKRSFISLSAAIAYLDVELKKNSNINSGRIYRLKENQLIKAVDVNRKTITQVTYHTSPEQP